ncbi:hypothetical protein [Thermomonas carbonis]|uniref:Uncharacterized protein n=1 Tax=Thermomonas carbonis TaxID=1463158 RepID=A0A7G9SPT5_9GAMM|nr:hypothetical protein [Thermomonas carbonis]QNN69860.1 hypothetical protein H9L16_14630 [Thermomonas carbonis]GHB95940.1 hypothetical protein GCM10010080_04610 [Thermomonas carbonis]
MSRFDGWLTRFIMMHGTPAALTIKAAAKLAGIRSEAFAQALHDSKLVRIDALYLGIDPDEWFAMIDWRRQMDADDDVEESMVASAAARAAPKPSSDKLRHSGSARRLGVTRPHPANQHRDELNLPINPIEHPEPQGEWHAGLDRAGTRR